MRKLFLSLFLGTIALSPLYSDVLPDGQKKIDEIRELFNGPSIRVQLLQEVDGTQVEVKGPYNIYDPRTGKKLDRAYMASSYYMYPTVDGIKWGQEFPGVYQVLIVPDKVPTTLLIGGTEYRGMGYVYQIKGTLGAVNETSLEDFVASIMSTHIPQQIAQTEALAALMIAMRTEALSWIEHGKNPYWDIKAGLVGFRGSSVERHDSNFDEARRITKDLVLTDVNAGGLVKVQWFGAGEAMAPIHQIEQLAKEGKDARAILEKVFPEGKIVKIQSLKK